MQPTLQHHARVDVADVLRGLAVMGIILLHSIEHFNFYSFPDTAGQGALLDFTDRAIWDGLFFLLGGKAYAIFALLFGFSFFIQDDNQRMRGNDFRRRFCWRMLPLFINGNFNACFFTGEILVMYSLIGIVLVLTCRLSTKWVLAIAAVCMLQPVAIYNVIRASLDSSYVTPIVPSSHLWGAAFAMQSGGTFLATFAGKTGRQSCPGMGSWPYLPDCVTVHARNGYWPKRTFPEGASAYVGQGTCYFIDSLLPASRIGPDVAQFHRQ